LSTLLFNSRRKQPLRLLHPLSALALIFGMVIVAGIFKTPSLVAGISGDADWALVSSPEVKPKARNFQRRRYGFTR